MEDFVAADETPLDFCMRQVEDCDIFVGVLGHYYGNSPPGDKKSFTEHEYDSALKFRKPRLMFMTPDDFPVPANLRESDVNYQSQLAFRSRALQERIISQFKTPDELALEITTAIFNFTSRGNLKININHGKCVFVVEGASTTEVRIEDISNEMWQLATNKDDLHLKKITIIPVSDPKPVVLNFSAGELPEGSIFQRCTGSYYRPRIGGVFEYASENIPRFEEISPNLKAILLEPAATNYLLNSNQPKSQWVSQIGPGRFTLWVLGEGSAMIKKKGKEIEGTATENHPFTFTLDVAEPIYIKVEGTLSLFQLNGGSLPMSYLPTTNATVTRGGDNLSISLPLNNKTNV